MVFYFYAGGLYSRLLFILALDESSDLGIRRRSSSGPPANGGPCSVSFRFEKSMGSYSRNSPSDKTIVEPFPICLYYQTRITDLLCRSRIWQIGLRIQTGDYRL